MASTSASSVQKSFKYDVFLNFQGEDVRTTFVDHLYHALHNRGIITYKDDEKIEQGKRINDQLMRSIEDSRIYIIVFSKNYASSSWCLDELVKIMQCQKMAEHTAYPIFFDVEPTEVRHQSGAVGEAFAKHVRGRWSSVLPLDCLCHRSSSLTGSTVDLEKEEDVGRWRNALKKAAGLAGIELKNTFNGHEAKFIKQIVEKVSLKLHFFNSSIDENLVGIETRVKDIVSSLEIDSDDVRMIGIRGIGGGGKTTLARAVFDYISIWFESKSFVENVREGSEGFGLKELQKTVLQNVLDDKNIDVESVYDGKNMMKKMMPDKKVLVVLDDVDDIEQLKALVGEPTWFTSGSKIIITTRDKQVLVAYGVHNDYIHDVSLLSYGEAICLFSRCAFKRELPFQEYNELSRKVVHYAAGLPLTITVLGSLLCGRAVHEWEDALERLKSIPENQTLKRLELSYNGLENDHKEIFLEVACVLRNVKKFHAIRILESFGFNARIGLSVLEQKSLITVSDTMCLRLHDLIAEMGWNIVRRLHPDKPSRHKRLWIKNEIENILVNESGTEATRSIMLRNSDLHPEIIMKGLRNMTELRLLHVNPGRIEQTFVQVSEYLPEALQSLCWLSYPFGSLPESFQANKLVYLVITNSKISKLWERGEGKVLNKLKFLDFRYSKLRTFDLMVTPHLESLDLRRCTDFVELQLPVECPNLKFLDLSYSKVSTLNLGMTRHLEELNLEYCTDFIELQLPNECPNLRFLSLRGSKVNNLNLGMTPHLEHLNLNKCDHFVELQLPVECSNLKFINLRGSKVSKLNLGMTPHLVELNLNRCYDFLELHIPVECVNLKVLTLWGSKKGSLNLGMTPHLEVLNLYACNEFELHIPVEGLKLKALNVKGSNVHNLNNGLTPHLEILDPAECYHLQNVHAPVGCLKNLVHIRLDCWSGFVRFAFNKLYKSPDLDSVATLEIDAQCARICPLHPRAILPDFSFKCIYDESGCSWSGNLEKLMATSTGLCVCKNLENLSATICGLQHLRELTLKGSILGDLWQLDSLEKLSLWDLKIRNLPDSIFMLKHLKSLEIDLCGGIERLSENICRLECLERLAICNCSSLQDISNDICNMKCLKRLKLFSCIRLEKLPEELGHLVCLEVLDLAKCVSLRDIPNNICNMKCLKRLDLSYCHQVKKLPEKLGRLGCLKELNIDGAGISRLPRSIHQLEGMCISASTEEQLRSYGFTSFIYKERYGDVSYYVEL